MSEPCGKTSRNENVAVLMTCNAQYDFSGLYIVAIEEGFSLIRQFK